MFKKLATATAALLVAFMPLMSTHVYAATSGSNLITNPSVETGATNAADGWTPSMWEVAEADANTTTFTTTATGHTGRALKIDTTAYVSGASNWTPTAVAVTPGQSYQYEVWYQSDVATQVGAEFTAATGAAAIPYMQIGTVAASPGVWTKYTATITAPAGAASITVFNILASIGSLTVDDFSLTSYTATPFTRPLVTVSFDDGWINQYSIATPILASNGDIKATYNVLSGETTKADTDPERVYMTSQEVNTLYKSGHEIASHTVDHCSMTGNPVTNAGSDCPTPMTAAALKVEMETSKSVLEGITGVPGSVTNFAYPYGDYDATSIAAAQAAGYKSQRTVEQGTNTKDNLDLTKLKAYEVNKLTTTADVEGWIQAAIAQKSWIILFYHEVANTPAVADDADYTTNVADFTAQMAYINANRAVITPVTMAQAVAEVSGAVVVPPVTKPTGDIANNDNLVNDDDATLMFANWGPVAGGITTTASDLTHNGTVDDDDATILFANWSK